MTERYRGPLFIVGMSRSGTKLLRDILNNNDAVSIPPYESHFLPYLVKNFASENFPLEGKSARKFIKLVKSSIFYNEIKANNENFQDIDFEKLVNKPSLQQSIKYLMTELAARDGEKKPRIWGDKTPNNLLYIGLLKKAFPSAKFIHIIRDPRERALSTQKAWGTSLLMAAKRWRDGVKDARRQGLSIGDSYTEITYEDFVKEPRKELKRLCGFIGIKYSDSMLELKDSSEPYKTANNVTQVARTVVAGNTAKYRDWLTQKEILEIESVVGDLAARLGYIEASNQEARKVKISFYKRFLLKTRDNVMAVRFHINRWGLHQGIKYLLWRRKVTNI